MAETADSMGYRGKELRLIRDTNGYYFMAAKNFKNVYVFRSDDGSLVLSSKIMISEFSWNERAGVQSEASLY